MRLPGFWQKDRELEDVIDLISFRAIAIGAGAAAVLETGMLADVFKICSFVSERPAAVRCVV